ncbi:MAG: hypothetical protein COT41_03080 [Candidatus Portnoybacteria bacterium CG08_land_8_20_14_0_20_40_83]|uniref:Glycosyltransferase 2-like domain-containing protein n=1 Tax=Candidatus Portnoybacteria bacterium CG11_big_fil_rev_8_21_14_0_20_40_15 TaxID=1974817 RepID=A0A2H0KT43_9BACT|nr:MAG: hypothetical protein COV84_02050 [Candidatus Portnoybacteria bacterium CG11_big_fil_rev_8_21_14_0_20_40_15]PIS30638.1 MAG: hypothetical protein COT41_03080 [Candidatus Portnoybacteria bacterium CG08_land_8_20_14_0_20_40_83]
MDLSVIVTNYKTPELLKLCLNSLKEALAEIEAEVFVMDSQSDEDTEFVVKEFFPEFQLIPFQKNLGFRALVNEGLKRVKGKYILILNSDIILKEDAIEKLINYLDIHEDVAIVGPQLLNLDGSVQESCLRFFGPLTILARRTIFGKTNLGKKLEERFLMRDYNHKQPREVDWLLGSSLLVRADAAREVGPMDDRFFMYFEDVDWCRRFWQAGFKIVYFPEAKMYHYHLRTSKKAGGILDLFMNKYTRIHISSAVKYYLKYGFKNIQYPIS